MVPTVWHWQRQLIFKIYHPHQKKKKKDLKTKGKCQKLQDMAGENWFH